MSLRKEAKPMTHLSTWERICEAARYAGWKTESSTGDSITFGKDADWITIWWTHPDRAPVTVRRAVVHTHDADGDSVIESIDGRGKADRVESVLWAAADPTPEA